MKILVFDIGGTSIKYGTCVDNALVEVKEIPTEAKKGGRHIMDTLISLIEPQSGYDAIGISTAVRSMPTTATSSMPTKISPATRASRSRPSWSRNSVCLLRWKTM